jgi:hypothetical protein
MSMSEQDKKVIRIQTPTMTKPISVRCEPGMEEMTIAEVLDSVAGQYEANSQASEASAVRSLAQRAVSHNGSQQAMSTKVKDLAFQVRSTRSGNAMVADLTFTEQYTGGRT